MARKRKEKPVQRRSKKLEPIKDEGPDELCGWKVDDIVWAVQCGQTRPSMLKITRLNHKDKTPSLSCSDINMGRYCVVAAEWCSETSAQAKKLYIARSGA